MKQILLLVSSALFLLHFLLAILFLSCFCAGRLCLVQTETGTHLHQAVLHLNHSPGSLPPISGFNVERCDTNTRTDTHTQTHTHTHTQTHT